MAVITTATAFFIGNSLMFCFGAISGVYVGGNDIFEVMIALNLGLFAIIVLGLGLGLSNITKIKKSPLVLVSGALGTITAMWLYNNFCGWLASLFYYL